MSKGAVVVQSLHCFVKRMYPFFQLLHTCLGESYSGVVSDDVRCGKTGLATSISWYELETSTGLTGRLETAMVVAGDASRADRSGSVTLQLFSPARNTCM